MSATGLLIAALVAAGMDAAEAAGLVARAAVEMTGALTKKSSAAVRQQRYRDRNKASPSVTERNDKSEPQTVTNHNESVTRDAASLSKEEKKEVIKEKRESRATQLPEDWRPLPKHWDEAVVILGSPERSELELRKFKLHAADKGRLAKNWNAAWVKWAIQAIEYGARNGNQSSNNRTDPAAGRATTREAQLVAAVGRGAANRLAERTAAGPDWPTPGSTGSAEVFDFGKRAESAR